MLLALDLFSTTFFGFAGASIAVRNRLNYFGIVFSAFFASTGGGTVRDIALRSEAVFWIDSPSYLLAVFVAIVIALSQRKTFRVSRPLCRVINSLGTAVFVLIGVLAALEAGCSDLMVLLYGVLTGIGGGLIRQAVFERRSILRNLVNICSAVAIAFFCYVLLQWSTNITVAIVCLATIHFLINECHRRSKKIRYIEKTASASQGGGLSKSQSNPVDFRIIKTLVR